MEMSPRVTTSSLSNRPTYSCVRCADRKVKCDRQNPCRTCVIHNVQSLFRPTPPSRKKERRKKEGSLKNRLEVYEALLQKYGIDRCEVPNTAKADRDLLDLGSDAPMSENTLQVPEVASAPIQIEQPITTSQLLRGEGKSRLVDNSLWSRVIQEFPDSEDALEDSSSVSDTSGSDDENGLVLGISTRSKNKYSHPSTEHIQKLWQVYVENFDPLTKIVHVPSLQPAIQKATYDIEKVPRNFEALMFAVYAAAVMSLNDEGCKQRFNLPRDALLQYYTSATKWALSRAKFLGTVSIVVLQALVIHLFSVRNVYGPRTVWTMTGVAIRIAEGMGLHRDGATLGVPPFEAQIRARIWWQLKLHDFRATELIGLAKFRGIESDDYASKPPANINDSELYPGMSSPPTSSTELTDMTFFAFKLELANFVRRSGAKFREQEKDTSQLDDTAARSDTKTKDEFTKEIKDNIEAKFLRFCDPSQPLQLLTMLVTGSTLNIVRFLAHHPRRWGSQEQTPKHEQDYVWSISLALLEQTDIIQSDRRLQGFAWWSGYYLHWHVLIHVLDILRAKPLMPDLYTAWRLIEATYRNNPDMISNTKKPIHVAVGNLCLNAFNAYENAFMREQMDISKEPTYITKLRQQRESAKARRKAPDTNGKTDGVVPTFKQSQVNEKRPNLNSGIPLSETSFSNDEPQQSSSSHLPNLNQVSESEPFWLTSGLDNSIYGNTSEMMNMDTDLMLAQDFRLKDANTESIDWAQWDAWLGEQSVACADSSAGSAKPN